MSNQRSSRILRTASVQALIAGIQKHLGTATLYVDSTSFAAAALVSKLQGQVDAENAAVAATAAYHEVIQRSQDPAMAAFLVKLVQAIRIMFASTPTVLADFGIDPPKPRTVDPETKVLAAAKARATRKARHTMGPVQEQDVHGTVTSVTLGADGSETETPAPAAAVAPAAPAAPGNGTSGGSAPAAGGQ